jgi:phenylalanyl-tRNA synthetase alpha chain
MDESIDRLRRDGLARIAAAGTAAELEAVRVALLGRRGELTLRLRGLKELPDAERPAAGDALNRVKDEFTAALAGRQEGQGGKAVPAGGDLTLPGRPLSPLGSLHPLPTVLEEICDIFYGLGFSREAGPDVELDYYNFTALNFPDDHPSRDSQDTFYIDDRTCLRTQTSPAQVRIMERRQPPLAVVVPGRVYRNEAADASHASEFYQIEGFCVDRAVSLADLKTTVHQFVHAFFGPGREIRFRPHFFPFTEPSVEVDMACAACGGAGCSVCGRTGWLEIMGAGMIHPHVFAAAGYPADAYTGYAFGMGIDRIAMLRHGIPDIRLLYENDLRFLAQFRGAT